MILPYADEGSTGRVYLGLFLSENAMLADLKIFEHKEPELVVAWNDSQTEARDWLVINSLRGGAAGGGARMKKGLDLQEALRQLI